MSVREQVNQLRTRLNNPPPNIIDEIRDLLEIQRIAEEIKARSKERTPPHLPAA